MSAQASRSNESSTTNVDEIQTNHKNAQSDDQCDLAEKGKDLGFDIEKDDKNDTEKESLEVIESVDPFLVDWDGPDDPENPLNWSRKRKWWISAVGIGFCGMISLSVSGYAIGLGSLKRELGVGNELANLGITVFTITFGLGGLVLAPLSEQFGRNGIYTGSAFLFALSFIPQALAPNIATLLVFRTIGGIGASTGVALSSGTLADVWSSSDRGLPMGMFSFAAFMFTGVAPPILGWVELEYSFRIITWIVFSVTAVFSIAVVLVLAGRETRASVLLSRKAARLRNTTGDNRYYSRSEQQAQSIATILKVSLTRPFRLYFSELVLICFSIWLSFDWGVLYVFLSSIPLVYTRVYHFNAGQQGLVFISQILGSIFGLVLNTVCDRFYIKNAKRKGPEARLYVAMISAVLLPIGIFLYTWTTYEWIKPEVSMIGITIAYTALFGIYTACFSYIADSYTFYASSALSSLNAVRNVLAAFFPLFTVQMYDSLGIQAAGSMLGGVGLLLGLIPFVIYRYGDRLRAKSPYGKQLAAEQAKGTSP